MLDNSQMMYQGIILIGFLAIMYFLLVRPQKKKEQEIENMRNSIKVGDEIVTIGGVMGRVIKLKDDSLVIQVGADKTKFEIKRWAISSVGKTEGSSSASRGEAEDTESKKAKPKRLGKKESVEEEKVEAAVETVKEETAQVAEAVKAPSVEEAVEEAVASEESL